MRFYSKTQYVLIIVGSIAVFFIKFDINPDNQVGLFYQSEFASVPEGTLIRAEGDERVYYAEKGQKRWIDSTQTFMAQGFHTEDINTLTFGEISQYPDGEPITALTPLVLPREQKILPDLVPLAPYSLQLSTVSGRKVIRFTGSFWNKG